LARKGQLTEELIMRALITGAAGFVGGYLARHLLEKRYTVAGVVLPHEARDGIPSLSDDVEVIEADILEPEKVDRAFRRWKPEAIFHLAALSNPQGSWTQSRRTLETNILGSHSVLQAALETGLQPRVLLVGSSQQYGLVPEEEQPIREDRLQEPRSPYAVSKVSQEILGRQFFLSEELQVMMTRSFNHTGAGQAPSYVCSSFARQIAAIESGLHEPEIRVGNLSAKRDFSDVRDTVHAYVRIVESGTPAEPYNVCRGEAHSIQQILDLLLSLTDVGIRVEVDETRYHVVDAPLMLGDNFRLRNELGWEPRYSLNETLSDVLEYWRSALSSGVNQEEI
jgi:GDP-4-dehydro-6-deoxy-D-mannose reductase